MTTVIDYVSPKPRPSSGWAVVMVIWSAIPVFFLTVLFLIGRFPSLGRAMPFDDRTWAVAFFLSAVFSVPNLVLSAIFFQAYRERRSAQIACFISGVAALATLRYFLSWVFVHGIC